MNNILNSIKYQFLQIKNIVNGNLLIALKIIIDVAMVLGMIYFIISSVENFLKIFLAN